MAQKRNENEKLAHYLELIAPTFPHFPFGSIKASMLQEDNLTQFIADMDFSELDESAESLSGECCICLESFQSRSDMAVTKCNHRFHPSCLVEALTSPTSSHGCPLCRCGVQDLKPTGFDGELVRFFALLRFNLNKVEKCHTTLIDDIEAKASILTKRQTMSGRFDHFFRKATSKAEVEELLKMVRVDELFCAANVARCRKVLTAFDQRSGADVSSRCMEVVKSHRFARDSVKDATGRLTLLRAELLTLYQVLLDQSFTTPHSGRFSFLPSPAFAKVCPQPLAVDYFAEDKSEVHVRPEQPAAAGVGLVA